MEKKRNTTVKRSEPKNGQQLVINELRIESPDRTRKDIKDYINAVEHAESVHFPNRVALFNIYDRIITDGFLTGIIEKRIDAVCNKVIVYKDKSGKKIDGMDAFLESDACQRLKRDLMHSKFQGVSGMEFIAGPEFNYEPIPRRHIRPEQKKIVIDQYGEEGFDYETLDNVWIVNEGKDLGLLYKAAPYVIWKSGNIADWAQYIEIYGMPVTIIRYDGYDEKGKFEARKLIDEAGSALRICIPKELAFEMVDGKTNSNGDGKLQETFRVAMNQEMAILILGNTETTSSSSSSGYAQAKEHGKQQLEITKSDMKFLRGKFNDSRFSKILKSYGLPVVEGGRFDYEKEVDLAELKLRAEIDTVIAQKIPMDDQYYYDTYGYPKPKDYDQQKKQREQPPQDPAPTDPNSKPAPKPAPPKPEPKPKDKKLSAHQRSLLFKFRALLADFFAPAP